MLPDEVILVHRIEDEETRAFLESFLRSTPLTITSVPVSIAGVIHAENAALFYLLGSKRADIVTFMDDDARALPDWIKNIKSFFEKKPNAAALGGPDIILSEPESYHHFPVSTVGKITWYGKVIGNHHRKSSGLREVNVLKGVNMSVRTSYLTLLDNHLQGADPSRGNGVFWELDLCLHIKNLGGKIYFDPELIIEHDSNHAHFLPAPVVASTAHNLTYVMLKHENFLSAVVFIGYSLVIGNGHIHGLAKTISAIIKSPSRNVLWLSYCSLKGFFSGLRLAFTHR
jgi:GT2 family glycosyltransferase